MSEAVAGARYVVGFMFDKIESGVLLLRKTHPEWQAGRLNGIGGRIEDGEAALEAMRREFEEEVGIAHEDWQEFCVLSDARQWRIHFFMAHGPIWRAKSLSDEIPEIVDLPRLPSDTIPNLHWLIPMALSMKYERARCFQIQELS